MAENNKQSSSNKVYHHVRDLIVTRKIFPGNRINNEEITNFVGVSRTSIRPALQRLEFEGLVEIVPNKGAFVAKPNLEDLLQIYEIRKSMEIEAFKIAMEKITDEDLLELESILEEQKELEKDYSREKYVDINRRFHWVIAEATGNKYIQKYLTEIYNKIHSFMIFYDNSKSNNSDHQRIYEALRDKDFEKGKQAVLQDNNISLKDLDALK